LPSKTYHSCSSPALGRGEKAQNESLKSPELKATLTKLGYEPKMKQESSDHLQSHRDYFSACVYRRAYRRGLENQKQCYVATSKHGETTNLVSHGRGSTCCPRAI
jgi:hypothetical protein